MELHGFSDASEFAFATSIYLRVEYESGKSKLFTGLCKKNLRGKSLKNTIGWIQWLFCAG